jgi:hypothetical protein
MLTELSLHVLDIAGNSIRAGASLIKIELLIDTKADRLTINIEDNGCGMSQEQVQKVCDPFFTTRTTRKVGFGVPFFRQAALGCEGEFSIVSEIGKGTKVMAVFQLSHIDRMPIGDMSATIHTLVIYNEEIDFVYRYRIDEREFELDTRELKEIVGDGSLQEPEISQFIKEFLETNETEVNTGNIE